MFLCNYKLFEKGIIKKIMNELKINPELRDFIPPLSDDEKKQLEESLLKYGYKGSPIYIWNGYIIDGHNRYELCKKHNIKYKTENLLLGDSATIIDAMEWMINTQLGRRNLLPQQRIAVVQKFKKKIQEEANINQQRAGREYGNGKNSSSPNGEKLNENIKIHTDKELAKLAGVGTGTIARYNKVMTSNDDELKEKVKTGQVTVNKAYEEVRKREKRVCKVCGKEKKIIEFFGNDIICKECSRKESEKNINSQKSTSSSRSNSDMEDIYKDVLTAKNAKDQINQDYELEWLKDKCNDFISQVNDKFFDLLGVIEKMDREHISEAYDIFENFVSDVFNIQEKFNNEKEN